MSVRVRAMVCVVAMSASVALVACGPEKEKDREREKEYTSVEPSADPPAAPPAEQPAPEAPRSKEGAIQRYEEFLHAVGREDIKTVCEVAGPAAKQAEDQGFGPCESTFPITFQMISPEKKKALRTATVDPQRVAELAPDKFEIPPEAVRASATFSESEIGSSTMGYVKDEWYVVD